MPRISPNTGAALTISAALLLATSSAMAQTWRTSVGYDALVSELGGDPPAQFSGVDFVPPADTSWRYRKGTSEPSSPTDAWREVGFVEDGSWLTGQTPIGYDDGDDNTVLTDMQGFGGYTSVYLRHPFTVASGEIPLRLFLRVYVDDGAIVWINGVEVARLHVSGGFKAFNATASIHEAEWEEIVLTDPSSLLVEGDNVIAIHAINQNVNSSDFSIDAELLSPALRISQVEGTDGGNYLAEAWPGGSDPLLEDSFSGTGGASNQTFFVQSIDALLGYGKSTHARNVGVNYIYGRAGRTLAGDLEEVDGYFAGGWLEDDFLRNNTLNEPLIEPNPLQNHSWIADPDEETPAILLNEAVRRIDYAIERDGFLCVVGLNNESSTTVPPVLGTAYNVISVGRTDGEHSQGETLPAYDGSGRIKPEIVAPGTATSWATGMVSSAGTLLLAAAQEAGMPEVFQSPVLKSILMAGATKEETASWSRTSSQPLDTSYEAGELNVQNSYHILQGGKSTPVSPVGPHGWNDGTLSVSGSTTYTIEICEPAGEFSAILTWNRTVDGAIWLGDFGFLATVADMAITFERVDVGGPTLCDSSDSTLGNVEHVYLRDLTPGTYLLTVDTDVAVDYALAWRADPAPMPSFTMATGIAAGELEFAFANLSTGKTYSLESSGNLSGWTEEHSLVGSDAPAPFTLVGGSVPSRNFFRLVWDPAN